ncbi:hypothetical protein GGS20DRAFT_588639 [Poronia punctata]|nr:hypothetical protein GGS20DRAFT_588639 [Poronia punctata]
MRSFATLNILAAAVGSVTAVPFSTRGSPQQSGFNKKCDTPYFFEDPKFGPFFSANCKSGNDTKARYILNLDHCFTNDGGNIKGGEEGNFSHTCNNMTFSVTTNNLTASCKPQGTGNDPMNSTITLSDYIGAMDDGNLVCYGAKGELSK